MTLCMHNPRPYFEATGRQAATRATDFPLCSLAFVFLHTSWIEEPQRGEHHSIVCVTSMSFNTILPLLPGRYCSETCILNQRYSHVPHHHAAEVVSGCGLPLQHTSTLGSRSESPASLFTGDAPNYREAPLSRPLYAFSAHHHDCLGALMGPRPVHLKHSATWIRGPGSTLDLQASEMYLLRSYCRGCSGPEYTGRIHKPPLRLNAFARLVSQELSSPSHNKSYIRFSHSLSYHYYNQPLSICQTFWSQQLPS